MTRHMGRKTASQISSDIKYPKDDLTACALNKPEGIPLRSATHVATSSITSTGARIKCKWIREVLRGPLEYSPIYDVVADWKKSTGDERVATPTNIARVDLLLKAPVQSTYLIRWWYWKAGVNPPQAVILHRTQRSGMWKYSRVRKYALRLFLVPSLCDEAVQVNMAGKSRWIKAELWQGIVSLRTERKVKTRWWMVNPRHINMEDKPGASLLSASTGCSGPQRAKALLANCVPGATVE
ncbi:hypothetical protein JB92DRAFT_2835004 [Gautieria morchelliformis]|nr:hypothetical protein JB92DRAFT_2835004 [Gautieria morchelliformis]